MQSIVPRYTLEISSDGPQSPLQSLRPTSSTVLLGRRGRSIIIGRGPTATVDLRANKKVSRRHVTIHYDSKQSAFVAVVNGVNGAYVDCQFYESNDIQKITLIDGCHLTVAGKDFVFMGESDAECTSPSDGTVSAPDDSCSDDNRENVALELIKRIRDRSPLVSSIYAKRTRTIKTVDAPLEDRNTLSPPLAKPQQCLADVIVESFTFCGRSDMNLRELCSEIQKNQAYYRQSINDDWKMNVLEELEAHPFFILRPKNKLLTKPTQWWYNPKIDPKVERRELYANLCSVQPTRDCKLEEKRYYFKDLTQVKKQRTGTKSYKRRSRTLLAIDENVQEETMLTSDDPLASTVSSTDIGTDLPSNTATRWLHSWDEQ